MKIPLLLLPVALLLGGCVTVQQREDAASVATAGADAELQQKVERGHRLTPDEIIELSRQGVDDDILVRAVNRAPGGYDLKTTDIDRLKQAGVATGVIDTMLKSDRNYWRHYRGYRPYHGYRYYGHHGFRHRGHGHHGFRHRGHRHHGHHGHHGHRR